MFQAELWQRNGQDNAIGIAETMAKHVAKPVNQHMVLRRLVRKKFRTNERLEWWWTKFHAARRRRVWKLSEQQNHRCCYCGRLTWVYDGTLNKDQKYQPDRLPSMTIQEMATADHYVPSSKGGTEHVSNIVICCMRCNGLRGNHDAVEFWEMVTNSQKLLAHCQNLKKVRKLEKGRRRRERRAEKRGDKQVFAAFRLGYCCLISSDFKLLFEAVSAEVDTALADPKRLENRLQRTYGDLLAAAA